MNAFINTFLSLLLWCVAIISVYFAVFWFLVFLEGGAQEHKTRKLKKHPKVTIVIPAYNECVREETGEIRGVVADSIDAAMRLDYPKNRYEVIVVNDGSTDNTHKVISQTIKKYKGRNLKYINKKVNQGKHAAMNDALEIASGEFLVSLDGDSLMHPELLKEMLPYFADDKVACVCPNMKVLKPTSFLEKIQHYEYVINMFYKKLMSHIDCMHVAPGPFSIFRTKVLKEVGGYKEAYKTEDLEITYRLQLHKYKVVQVLNTHVFTKVPNSLRAFFRQRKRWFTGAMFNTVDYRKMLLNREYGDFGFIQLPMVLISPLLALTIIGTTIFYAIIKYYSLIEELFVIKWDVFHYLRALTFNFAIWDIDFITTVTSIFMLGITLVILFKAFKHSDERVFASGFKVPLLIFLGFYYLLISTSWIFVVAGIVTKRKLKW